MTASKESAADLVQRWQEERSNFHRDPICEIVEDYEEWRRSCFPQQFNEGMVERLARHLAASNGEPPEEPLYQGSETLAWHAWVDDARAALGAAMGLSIAPEPPRQTPPEQ